MNYVITLYRDGKGINVSLPVQNFNADNLPDAMRIIEKCKSTRFMTKIELKVILETWQPGP